MSNYIIQFPGLGLELNPPTGFSGGPLEVRFYGVIIALGLILAVLYALRRKDQFGISEDDLMDKMGLIRGAVTPFGILNNDEKDVVVFMDKDYEHKLMGIHPCDNTATVYVNCRDVAKLIKEHGNEMHFVKL